MPREEMADVKSQYETFIPQTQQELAKPGVDEAKAVYLKAWIQMMQEVVEAINKKL